MSSLWLLFSWVPLLKGLWEQENKLSDALRDLEETKKKNGW